MKTNSECAHAVLLADVVGSRHISGFSSQRDSKLQKVSQDHLEKELILMPYTVTAWDEFQVVLRDLELLPRVVSELRSQFQPLELWIAVGFGRTDALPKEGEAINKKGAGETFVFARESMDEMKRKHYKYRFLTRLKSADEMLNQIINIVYKLIDSLLQKRTPRQWETVMAYQRHLNLEAAAEQLGVDISTISRNLNRGSYWQDIDTQKALEAILRLYQRR